MATRVLVTGATGFVGRNLVETLSRRSDLEVHAVRFSRRAYDSPGVHWHEADLRLARDVDRVVAGMDVIVHAAAVTSGAKQIVTMPHIHVTDNVVMTSLLLRAAYDHAVKQFVYFSCSIIYPSGERPLREVDFNANDDLHPRYFGAGWTKLYIEKMCQFFATLGRTSHTVIRHSNIYGPHDKFDLERAHVFGATVTKVMTATNGQVVVWGSGEEARDLLHVDDLVAFVERAVDCRHPGCSVVNVGSGDAVTVKDLVHRILRASGRNLAIRHDPAGPTIPTSIRLDCSMARDRYAWEPRIPLDEGIRRTLDWWQSARGDGPRGPAPR